VATLDIATTVKATAKTAVTISKIAAMNVTIVTTKIKIRA